MNIKSLRAFLHIIDTGALSRASEKMCLSQPAVSRLIQLLEQEYSVKLFYRDQKSLVPTPEGEKFYQEAFRVVSAIDGFTEFFSQIRSHKDSPLRVICHSRMVNGLVVPAIKSYIKNHPENAIKLVDHSRRELGRRIVSDEFDIGVFTMPIQIQPVELIQMRASKLQVLVNKKHHLAKRDSLSLGDLHRERYIALNRELIIRQTIDSELMKHGETLKVCHEVSTMAAAHRMAIAGMGYTLTDALVFEPELKTQGTLIPLVPKTQIHTGFYTPKGKMVDDHIIAFIACLNAVCDTKLRQK
jgi:DNA-binding transcriptional LysR family regulator